MAVHQITVTPAEDATPMESSTSSDETTLESPKPKPTELRCNNLPDSENFADRGALKKGINEFCSEAEGQGMQDKDSGAIERK